MCDQLDAKGPAGRTLEGGECRTGAEQAEPEAAAADDLEE
jgi:hypothetical protein